MTPMVLSEAQWALIEPHCLGKESDPGRTGGDTRVFMEAVLWISVPVPHGLTYPKSSATGTPSRFRPWVKRDLFGPSFAAVSKDPEMQYAMVDGTIVKVHRHGQGAKGGLKARP